jgi:hypothetical protein
VEAHSLEVHGAVFPSTRQLCGHLSRLPLMAVQRFGESIRQRLRPSYARLLQQSCVLNHHSWMLPAGLDI